MTHMMIWKTQGDFKICLLCKVLWNYPYASHMCVLRLTRGILFIIYYWTDVLINVVNHEQVWLTVVVWVTTLALHKFFWRGLVIYFIWVRRTKRVKYELSYVLWCFTFLWYSWYAYVLISYYYVYCWLTLWYIRCWYVASILSTYCTNTSYKHGFHVGRSEDRLCRTVEFEGPEKWRSGESSKFGRWTFIFLYVFLNILDIMWIASQDVSFLTKLDGFWDIIIRDASAFRKYLLVYA